MRDWVRVGGLDWAGGGGLGAEGGGWVVGGQHRQGQAHDHDQLGGG